MKIEQPVTLTKNPILPFQELKGKAMGFFINIFKTIQSDGLPSTKRSENPVSVDLGHSHLLVLAAEKRAEHMEISSFRLEPRPLDSGEISEKLKGIFRENSSLSKKVRIAIKGQGVVVRILPFPQMSRKDFSDAIRYEVEKYIPFKANEVVYDFQILSENVKRGNSEYMEVLLVAVKKTEIYDILRTFQDAGLEVELIDISAFAFANFLEWCFPETKKIPIGFLDIGNETSTFGILIRGKPTFIRDISFGGIDIEKILKRRLGLEEKSIYSALQTPQRLSSECQEVLQQAISGLLMELKLSLGYYQDRITGAEPIEGLFLGGGGSRFILSTTRLEEEVEIPVRKVESPSKVSIKSGLDNAFIQKNRDLIHVALGLCLR